MLIKFTFEQYNLYLPIIFHNFKLYKSLEMIKKSLNLTKFAFKNPLTKLLQFSSNQKPIPKIPAIGSVKNEWNEFADGYSKFDLGPQTFYYSFLTLMNLHQCKNVLEVAVGSGKLLPVAIMLKNQSTKYLGVDLAQNMVRNTKANLQKNLQRYDSKLSLEEWCERNNLKLKVANAQQKVTQNDEKFDRIICNCVLMLTQNPSKMLQSLYDQAEQGCLLGITVWGDKEKNNFMTSMRQSIMESGFELPNQRSNFHLYKKVDKIAEKIGWQTVLRWEQNALFPLIRFDFEDYKELFMYQVKKLPENQQEKVTEKLVQKIKKIFDQKQGLNFACELYLFQK